MKILFLTSTYPLQTGDPIPSFVADLAEHLVERHDCQVHVVAPGSAAAANEETVNGVHVHRFQYAWPRQRQCLSYGAGMTANMQSSLRAKCQLPAWLTAMTCKIIRWAPQCDLMHAHWVEPGFLAALVKRQTDCPLVLTPHRIQKHSIARAVYHATFGASNMVLFNSRFTESLAQQLGLRCNGQVIYQGYDSRRFGNAAALNTWRKKLDIASDSPMVLALGRMVQWKGFHVLLKAWPQILSQCPQAQLVLAGDGPQRLSLLELSKTLGVSDSVHFTGAVNKSEVPSLMADADVFCNPGIVAQDGSCETLGIAVIEAMASGLACVGSGVGGIPEVIIHDKTGLLVEPSVPSALADAIIRLVAQPDLRQRMARAGKNRAKKHFCWSKIADETFQAYCRVLKI